MLKHVIGDNKEKTADVARRRQKKKKGTQSQTYAVQHDTASTKNNFINIIITYIIIIYLDGGGRGMIKVLPRHFPGVTEKIH
jgi:hypothetical protein